MKRSDDDRMLGSLLKEHAPDAGDNPWFTKRVLNRLPERQRSHGWLWSLLCIVAVVMCGACWAWLLHDFQWGVITVRDVLNIVAMMVITLAVVWQSLSAVLR